MDASLAALIPAPRSASCPEVHVAEPVLARLLDTTTAVHAAGLKSFGLLVADPADPRFPFVATDVAFFDPTKNRRNDPAMRPAFEAQGTYFRSHDDADLEAVALFHVHRRQPANFSVIDYKLHNPAYAWHLIISLRDPEHPVLAPFGVRKDLGSDLGISPDDHNEGSEQTYRGPEVTRLRLVVAPATDDVPGRTRRLARTPV